MTHQISGLTPWND